jgi:hypothetical protein
MKKGWKPSPQNKLVQYSEENEENRYPEADNKTKINYTKDPRNQTRTP